MRNPSRIDPILESLSEYWHAHPDMRLGQIIDNARAFEAIASDSNPDVFYIEDDALWAGLTSLPGYPHTV